MGINKDFVPQTTVVMVLHPGHSIIDQAHTVSHHRQAMPSQEEY